MKDKNNNFIDVIISLGFKPQEAKIYLACLKIGQATVSQISNDSGIQRTFIYDILEHLVGSGIISEVEISGVKKFSAISVEKLKSLQKKKLKAFEETMPELKALEKTVGDRPKVQFFEEIDGFVQAQNDTLEMVSGSEILAYFTGEGLYEEDPKIPSRYIRERVDKNIKVRAIGPDTAATRKWTRRDKEQLRTTRIIPAKQFPFANEINIYGNKISILSLVGEIIAVIIESESVAKTQKAIFELAWIGAQKIGKK